APVRGPSRHAQLDDTSPAAPPLDAGYHHPRPPLPNRVPPRLVEQARQGEQTSLRVPAPPNGEAPHDLCLAARGACDHARAVWAYLADIDALRTALRAEDHRARRLDPPGRPYRPEGIVSVPILERKGMCIWSDTGHFGTACQMVAEQAYPREGILDLA